MAGEERRHIDGFVNQYFMLEIHSNLPLKH